MMLSEGQLREMLRRAEVRWGKNDPRTVKIRVTIAERQLGVAFDQASEVVRQILGDYKAVTPEEQIRSLDPRVRPAMGNWSKHA